MKKRQIKFRCWRDTDKSMSFHPEMNMDWHIANNNGENVDVDSGHFLMQFTGLKDRNGKDIYESDIVRSKTSGEQDDEIWTVEINPLSAIASPNGKAFDNSWIEHEVIGNVYESPELLETKSAASGRGKYE